MNMVIGKMTAESSRQEIVDKYNDGACASLPTAIDMHIVVTCKLQC